MLFTLPKHASYTAYTWYYIKTILMIFCIKILIYLPVLLLDIKSETISLLFNTIEIIAFFIICWDIHDTDWLRKLNKLTSGYLFGWAVIIVLVSLFLTIFLSITDDAQMNAAISKAMEAPKDVSIVFYMSCAMLGATVMSIIFGVWCKYAH